jgi:hypothetical protein
MQTERPRVPTVYVAITNAHTRERRHVTVYNATLDDVERRLSQTNEQQAGERPRRVKASA